MDEVTTGAVVRRLQKADNDLRAARAAMEAVPSITDAALTLRVEQANGR